MKTCALAIVLAAALAGRALGQDPAPPPRPPAWVEAEHRLLDALGQGLDPRAREQQHWEWRQILDGLGHDEREAFFALPFPEKLRRARELQEAWQARRDAVFLDSLGAEERAALDGLDASERRRRLAVLRLAQQLERVVLEAEARGLLGDGEAEALRAKAPREQAAALLDLQKRIFLDVHGQALGQEPPPLQRELRELPPAAFFRHPFVERFRMFELFTPEGVATLRSEGRARIDAVLDAIGRGAVGDDAKDLLTPEGRTRLESMDPAAREELVRTLKRTLFRASLGPGGPGPGPGPFGHPMPPRELFERLTPAERRELLRMPREARMRFIRERFPDAADAILGPERPHPRDPRRPRQRLRDLLDRLDALPPGERRRLLDLPFQAAARELLGPPPPPPERDR